MASGLEKQIRLRLDETVTMMLRGAAADYTAYASLVARYRVLEELLDWTKERNAALEAGEKLPDDDD